MRSSDGVYIKLLHLKQVITHKFITEYTDRGYMKVIFGSGNGESAPLSGATQFNIWQMRKILNNNNTINQYV